MFCKKMRIPRKQIKQKSPTAEHTRKSLHRGFCVSNDQPVDAECSWSKIPKKYFQLYRQMPGRTRRFTPYCAHTTTPKKTAMGRSICRERALSIRCLPPAPVAVMADCASS